MCWVYCQVLEKYYVGLFLLIYVFKVNSFLVMSSFVVFEGLGLDVVLVGELLIVLYGGMFGECMVLYGNNKFDEELLFVYVNKVMIVVDNQYDFDCFVELVFVGVELVCLMLCFIFGIECYMYEYICIGYLDSKFGFDFDQVEFVFCSLVGQFWF